MVDSTGPYKSTLGGVRGGLSHSQSTPRSPLRPLDEETSVCSSVVSLYHLVSLKYMELILFYPYLFLWFLYIFSIIIFYELL